MVSPGRMEAGTAVMEVVSWRLRAVTQLGLWCREKPVRLRHSAER